MRRIDYVFLLCIIVFVHSAANSTIVKASLFDSRSKPKVHSLYFNDKMDNSSTYAILQDHDGFLWIGTDGGLRRYDGYQFTRFLSDPKDPDSIGTSTAITLMLQRDNTLWIGGNNLNRFNSKAETFDKFEVSDNRAIWALIEDSNNIIWVGGSGFGLIGFDPKQGKVVHEFLTGNESGANASFINDITAGTDEETLWVASSAGIYRFNVNTFELVKYPIPGDFDAGTDGVKDIMVAKDGIVWVATQEGLVVLNPLTSVIHRFQHDPNDINSLSTNDIWSVFQDSKGNIWIGTDKQGVSVYDPKTNGFMHIPSSNVDEYSFPPTSVDNIFEDDLGSLWFTVRNYGVRRISPQLEIFRTLENNDKDTNSLAFNNVLAMLEDKKGFIWIATDGGGLEKLDPLTGQFTHFTHDPTNQHSLSSNSVISLEEDEQGKIWVGTWAGGVNIYDPKTNQFSHIKRNPDLAEGKGLSNNNIFDIYNAPDGQMWFSVWHRGIQRFDPKNGEYISYFPGGVGKESGIVNSSINDILAGKDGIYWIAGYTGLERFDSKTEKFESILSREIESVYDLYSDNYHENLLWLATSRGFVRLDIYTLQARFFTTQDGLSENQVTSIERDNNGFFWLGTRNGLNRFDPISGTFSVYDQQDGLTDSQFNVYSHLHTDNGTMLFGGPKGVNIFNPNKIPKNTHVPNTVITNFELFQEPVKISKDSFLSEHINLIKQLTLNYQQRDFTFEFSALNFISPEKNRYKYRLKGLTDEWKEVGASRRYARYVNIPPGNYQFEVIGSNNSGVWSNTSANVSLLVLAPWWMTWWARLLFLLLMLTSLYAFVYWRLRTARRNENRLKLLVSHKTQELSDLNVDLEKRVELRTKELQIEIEERRNVEEKLFHMAFHDQLTNLPNRAWLVDKLAKLIQSCRQSGHKFSLIFLDGDRFKQINDTHGHMVGDKLLLASATRIKTLLPDNYQAVRLGGDEFTVLNEMLSSEDDVINLGGNIIEAFEQPFMIENNTIFFKVSIGAVFCGQEYKMPEQVLRDADIAMYSAKEQGRGVFQMFDDTMREKVLEKSELESELHLAIERNEFSLVYQPIINFKSGKLQSFEALLRWNNQSKGNIPPDKFIPIAEECGLILSIGMWVMEEVCHQTKTWLQQFEFEHSLTVHVNLSSLQFSQPDLIKCFDAIIKSYHLEHKHLILELTESSLMENIDSAHKILTEFNKLGMEIAIDDFGTGYSSLSYLDELPLQELKIDRKFVSSIENETQDRHGKLEIVKATISLAHNLNMQVIAEGIETQYQYDLLKNLDCDYGQGYLIAKPLTAQLAQEYMERTFNQKAKPITFIKKQRNDVISHLIKDKDIDRRKRRK